MKQQTLKVYNPPLLTIELQFTSEALLDDERLPRSMINSPVAIYEVDQQLLDELKRRTPLFKFEEVPIEVDE